MQKKLVLFILLIPLFISSLANAQPSGQAELPDTPAGRQFKKFLQAIESGNHEEYINENFSKRFLEAFSLSEHLDFFRQVSMMHGGLTVEENSIQKSSDYEIVAVVKSKKRNAWRRIVINVEPDSPHKIASLGIERASAPSGEKQPVREMTEKEILRFVDSELEKMVGKDEFSGAALIARYGKPLFKKACGMASKEFGVPNNVDTKFNIGSINKSFTQMAIAQLLEQGKISLDDRIGKYRDDFPKEVAEKVTIRHLLAMRSGMGHYWNKEWWAKRVDIKTVDEIMDIIKKIPLDFEPGTRRQYSNSGYVVLGAIIEEVTGQSYFDYIRENIYKPAGMHNTDSYELDQIVPNLARGYTENRSKKPYANNRLQNNLFLHSVKGGPAGGGYSTLDDLNRYVEALKMNRLAGEKYINMVLGLFQNIDNPDLRPQRMGIAGGAPVGINAVVEADFKTGYTVIVLSNYDPPVAEEFGSRVLDLLQNQKQN